MKILKSLFQVEEGFKRVGFRTKRLVAKGKGESHWDVPSSSHVKIAVKSLIEKVMIEDHVQINGLVCDLELLKIGRSTYSGRLHAMGRKGTVEIGRYSSLGDEIVLVCGLGYHHPNRVSTYPFPLRSPFSDLSKEAFYPENSFPSTSVVIGHDVWIGNRAILTNGVTIGHGAIVASQTVVTASVPPYAIVAGNPGQIKKYRHDEETIKKLLALEWWNWPVEKIKANQDFFRLTGDMLKAKLGENLFE